MKEAIKRGYFFNIKQNNSRKSLIHLNDVSKPIKLCYKEAALIMLQMGEIINLMILVIILQTVWVIKTLNYHYI
ncbi:MAG: hypothetical protein CM15mP101_00030 [Flavobacteriaceae bacterium]|nr:MAG: hypothetical protein CM15mP101_00030 [Flavobacteriaceae bacterium]